MKTYKKFGNYGQVTTNSFDPSIYKTVSFLDNLHKQNAEKVKYIEDIEREKRMGSTPERKNDEVVLLENDNYRVVARADYKKECAEIRVHARDHRYSSRIYEYEATVMFRGYNVQFDLRKPSTWRHWAPMATLTIVTLVLFALVTSVWVFAPAGVVAFKVVLLFGGLFVGTAVMDQVLNSKVKMNYNQAMEAGIEYASGSNSLNSFMENAREISEVMKSRENVLSELNEKGSIDKFDADLRKSNAISSKTS
jgi:hypothetical protein